MRTVMDMVWTAMGTCLGWTIETDVPQSSGFQSYTIAKIYGAFPEDLTGEATARGIVKEHNRRLAKACWHSVLRRPLMRVITCKKLVVNYDVKGRFKTRSGEKKILPGEMLAIDHLGENGEIWVVDTKNRFGLLKNVSPLHHLIMDDKLKIYEGEV